MGRSRRRFATVSVIADVLRGQRERAVRLAAGGERSVRVLVPDSNVDELVDALVPRAVRGPGRQAALGRARRDARRINATTRRNVVRAISGGASGEERAARIASSRAWTRARASVIARTERKVIVAAAVIPERLAAGFTHVRLSDGDDWDSACRAANGAVWTIERYAANPIEHPNCVRRVVAWLKNPGG